MVSDLTLRLDMSRVQSSVQASIRPAVYSALQEIDVQAIIKQQLLTPAAVENGHGFIYAMMGYGESSPGTLIESLVRQSIKELAKQYVEREIRAQKDAIEEGFRKMMQGSTNRLVKAFSDAIGKSIEADWSFDLSVAAELSTGEEDESDDD